MRGIVLMMASLLVLVFLVAGCGVGGGSASSSIATTSRGEGRDGASKRLADEGAQRSKAYAGGEKSIEEFGSEAGGASRAAVLGTFTGYLESIAADDAAGACARLSAAVKRSLAQFTAGSARKVAGCAVALSELLAPTAAAIARRQADGRVTKVRVEGERAFVVFHAPGARLYQLTMVREGGEWKAATVAASVLVPSAATLG